MKKYTLITGLMILSTSAFSAINNPDFINAQKADVEVSTQNKNTLAQGFKLALGASSLDMEFKADGETLKDDLDGGGAVTLGYNKILNQEIGFNAQLVFIGGEPKDQKDSDFNLAEDMIVISANATYGINDKLYGFAGINSSRYSDKTYFLSYGDYDYATLKIENDSGIGYQLGAGYQLSKNFGLELSYTKMSSSATATISSDEETTTLDYDIETSGTQINLIGTF